MKIAGIQKNSFVDYPGRMAAVIFTHGCNMDCWYCHNRSILGECEKEELYNPEAVLQFFEERKRFLDGVVISGGEPTLQPDLEEYIKRIRDLGYSLKLDTNGTRPHVLRRLLDSGVVDYVAMDIKAPLERYEEVCCTRVDTDKIQASIDMLMKGSVDYEFRTTVVPELTEADVLRIAERIRGARLYVLQQFRQQELTGELVDYRMLKTPHSPAFIKELSERVGAHQTRGII